MNTFDTNFIDSNQFITGFSEAGLCLRGRFGECDLLDFETLFESEDTANINDGINYSYRYSSTTEAIINYLLIQQSSVNSDYPVKLNNFLERLKKWKDVNIAFENEFNLTIGLFQEHEDDLMEI